MKTLIVLIVYIVSVLQTRKFIQKAHSERGIYSGVKLDNRDGFIALCPIINTMAAIIVIFVSPLRDRKVVDWYKFFNVNN